MQKKFIHKPTGIVYYMAEIKVGEEVCFMLLAPSYGGPGVFVHWCAAAPTEKLAFGGHEKDFQSV